MTVACQHSWGMIDRHSHRLCTKCGEIFRDKAERLNHDPYTISFPLWRVVQGDEGGWFVQKPRSAASMGDIEQLAVTFTSHSSARIWADTLNAQLKVAIEAMMHKLKRDMIEAHADECEQPIIYERHGWKA